MKLRLSARRTAGCESSLWGTPNTMDHLPQRSPESLIRMRDETRKGRAKPANLREQVDEDTVRLWRTPKADDPNHGATSEAGILKRLEKGQTIRLQDQVNHPGLFRTPDAGCSRGAQSKERFAESLKEGRLLTLNDQVAHLFPTPRASDSDKGTRTPDGALKALARGHGVDLGTSVQIFPTPTCNDSKNNAPTSQRTENGRHSDQLNVVAGGSLNPDWVEWLMGFPIGWTANTGV
jgi:hypothetical protein